MIFPQVKCVISLFVYFIPLPRPNFPFVCTLGEKSLQHLGGDFGLYSMFSYSNFIGSVRKQATGFEAW